MFVAALYGKAAKDMGATLLPINRRLEEKEKVGIDGLVSGNLHGSHLVVSETHQTTQTTR